MLNQQCSSLVEASWGVLEAHWCAALCLTACSPVFQVAASQQRNVELEAELAAAMEGSTAAIRHSPGSGMLDRGDSGLPALKQGQSPRHELVLEAAKARLGLSPERSGAQRGEGDSVVRGLGRAVWAWEPASDNLGKPSHPVLP